MLETTIPWWRRALKFALSGFRSGFGVFARRAREESNTEAKFSVTLKETLKEESALIDPTPQAEIIAEAAPTLPTEPEPALPEIVAVVEPAVEAAQKIVEAVEIEPVSESVLESAEEPEPEPVAETEIAAEAESVAEPEPAAEARQEAETETEPAVAEIVEEAKPLAEAESVAEFVVEAEQEPVVEVEVVEVEAVIESAPEPVAETAPATFAEREVPAEIAPTHEREVPPPLELTAQPTAEEAAQQKADERAADRQAARQKKLDESAEQSPFSVLVGKVYDGPLDLLLDLIRKQDIDIYDIPIARITAQFLAYVNQLKAGDVDVAGEFIYTASLLIHIKSKMLLPRAATGPEDAAEDPRRELVERLLEHERFKNAAQMLQQKQMLEAASWTNPGVREFKDEAAAEPEIAADTVDLVRIFRDILERARSRPVFNLQEDSVTVGQMIRFLARRLTMEDKPVALRRLLSHTRSERALIAMFLALLELVRMQAILLRQDAAFSEIFIKKHSGFDALMNEDLINARDDWR
jgi:segregation and condensation protein A